MVIKPNIKTVSLCQEYLKKVKFKMKFFQWFVRLFIISNYSVDSQFENSIKNFR